MSEAIQALPIEGKLIAIVPEHHYTLKGQACPFPNCQSQKLQTYVTDNKEVEGDFIADTMKCPECNGMYVIVSTPQLHIFGPIILNWTLTEKGVNKYGKKGSEAQGKQVNQAGAQETGSDEDLSAVLQEETRRGEATDHVESGTAVIGTS